MTDSKTTGISAFPLGWPWEAQSSPRVARESSQVICSSEEETEAQTAVGAALGTPTVTHLPPAEILDENVWR